MNQLRALQHTIKAASLTWDLSDKNHLEQTGEPRRAELTLDHAKQMLARVESCPSAFSSSKLGRWLGWVQAAAVAAGALTLDGCKFINKVNSEDEPTLDLPANPEIARLVSLVRLMIETGWLPRNFGVPTGRPDYEEALRFMASRGEIVEIGLNGRLGYQIKYHIEESDQ